MIEIPQIACCLMAVGASALGLYAMYYALVIKPGKKPPLSKISDVWPCGIPKTDGWYWVNHSERGFIVVHYDGKHFHFSDGVLIDTDRITPALNKVEGPVS